MLCTLIVAIILSINIHVGLDMHLYDDIGDASSSLRGWGDASPSSGEAYRDRQITTNFESWVEIFCVPTCFRMRIPKPCLTDRQSVCPSVRTPKKNHHSFVNISPTLVIDTWMERSSRVLQHGNPKFELKKKSKFEFWLVLKSWNHHSFVNISPTLVIDTSIERSSRVLRYGNSKKNDFFQKKSKLNFDLYLTVEITLASSISVLQ